MEELQISGKRYISSRRVAKDNGYHTDYIGQLIRGGKIKGQKVGRAWYVDAESFDAYVHGEGANTKADSLELVADSKEESTQEENTEIEEPTAASEPEKKPEPEPELEPEPEPEPEPISEPEQEKEASIEIKVEIREEPEPKTESYKPQATGLRYYSDDAPLLPEIPSKRSESRINVRQMAEVEEVKENIPQQKEPQKKIRKAPVLALLTFGLASLVLGAVLSSALSLNINVDKDNSASAIYSFDFSDSTSLLKSVK